MPKLTPDERDMRDRLKASMIEKIDEQIALLDAPKTAVERLQQFSLYGLSKEELGSVRRFINSFYTFD